MWGSEAKITPLDDFVNKNAPICYGILMPGKHDPNGVPVIKVKNIKFGRISTSELLFTSKEIDEAYTRSKLKEGDLLLAIRGSTGRVAIVPKELEGANITQDTARIRVKEEESSEYLFYALQSAYVQRQIALNTIGQAVKGINVSEVRKLRIHHPPHPEQKKIARILSTWDKAIETVKKLIENSKAQKKALMQQLLTGKRRLPGFDGEWKKVELGKLLNYKQPTPYLVKSTMYSNDHKTPVLTAGKTFILGYTNEESGIYQDNLPVIIFDDFTTASKFVDFPFKAKSSAMKILTSKEGASIKYIFEAMQMLNYPVGGHQRHWISIYSNLVVSLPDNQEQQKIATILTTADKEIATLQQKLDCLKQEKKSLMQQLLTGKRRVKVDNRQ